MDGGGFSSRRISFLLRRNLLPQGYWDLGACTNGMEHCLQAAGYLAIENIYHQNASEEGSCEESISRDEEPFDEATLVSSNKNDMHIYDYHILYSFTFRVPVLYFRGYQSDGCPLKLVDIEKDLPAYSLKLLRESKWAFITQETSGSSLPPSTMVYFTSLWYR
ncbi:ubiquitin-like-conjugating enzyme ATG10 isoform X5 [Zingiber officinale]|uniref:ubiquitin-like-conjugating enzyme ATG10 isoform X5 n=1 Tax=Zingiber officinale TaxID=94328 RepID=UPI001C4B6670|nr:ubiquitin-like-conjugating enzyme ATG10 isoform X5 [Zingiber officinale]